MSIVLDKIFSDYGITLLAILIMIFLIVLALMFASEQGLIDLKLPSLW